MTQNTVTVNGVEVASTLSQPTHISIHIHQESVLTQLLKAGGSLKELCASWRDPGPHKTGISYGLLAGGVIQVLLGAVSCALGVLLYFGPWTELRDSGCALWAGCVAIATGAGVIVYEKRRSILSGWAFRLLALVGTVTAVAAVSLCVYSITWENSIFFSSICDFLVPTTTATYYGLERPYDYRQASWQEDDCKRFMQTLRNLFLAIRILLLAVSALQLLVSLASMGLGLRILGGQSFQPLDEEDSEKKLLGENSMPPSSSSKTTPAMVL
ncbi:transmembrane protein 176B [Artibeus jamaicensis]|uniref:transmembrane protein 176B n=1 Tax=Artibeus jamaicensis TaxID=9417 RepID=UPI00235AF7EB|nr:transmembrane protein 176B [Artibeus jamaicensis]XP_036987813.2 transmembrane protein 176B [Artibeus jamaicensis]XP_036987815.2 transmembrane protein 176B [Artibeus jamaicensis]